MTKIKIIRSEIFTKYGKFCFKVEDSIKRLCYQGLAVIVLNNFTPVSRWQVFTVCKTGRIAPN